MVSSTGLRYSGAALLGAGVTVGLFLFMHQLISSGSSMRGALPPIPGIRFGPVEIPEEITTRSRRLPPRPPPRDETPPPPRLPVSSLEPAEQQMPHMELPSLDVPLSGGAGLFIGGLRKVDQSAEGDVVPMVVIRPMYPRDAALRGIEGWVKIQFTITETGAVKDPEVIDADPPGVFNREALRAILKWKFKPRVVDGVAVERLASQVVEFSLDDS